MNYRESLYHQYMCLSSVIGTCIKDDNVYFHSPVKAIISLDNFCGYIDGRNALQSPTIWIIVLSPNIHIHFLKFALFDNY